MLLDKYYEIFSSNLPANSRNSSKCMELNCPACVYMGERRHDTKRRGGLFYRGGEIGYNCFNCGFKFRMEGDKPLPRKAIKFLELLGASENEVNQLYFLELKLNPISIARKKKTEYKRIDLSFTDVPLPKRTYLLHDIIQDVEQDSSAFKAFAYAKKRGIGNHPYLLWIDDTYDNYNKRLTIPYLYKDRIVGYMGRSFLTDNSIKRFVRQNPNPNYVFNIDSMLKSNRRIILINESEYDAIQVDGISTMGSNINQKQIDTINSFKGRKILIPDLDNKGLKPIDIAIRNNWEVFFPQWNKNYDLGDAIHEYGVLFVVEQILQQSLSNSLEISVRKNLIGV